MPVANASAVQYAVDVDSKAYSAELAGDWITQSEGLTTSGLIRTTANIQFQERPDSTFTVDPVETDEWAIGNEVAVQVLKEDNSTQVAHPVMGSMRILLDPHVFDEVDYQSRVRVGDRLSLLDVDNPASEEADIDPLVGTSRLNVINAYLVAAGISEGLSSVPAGVLTDNIRVPVQSFEGQSFIEVAGIFAFNNPGKHCFIYQHRTGQIRIAVYEDIVASPILTVHQYDFPTGQAPEGRPVIDAPRVDPTTFEKPAERLKLTGNRSFVVDCGPFAQQIEEQIITRAEFDPVRYAGDQTPVVLYRNTIDRTLVGNVLTETTTREYTRVSSGTTGGLSPGFFTVFSLETSNVEVKVTTFNSDDLAILRVFENFQSRFYDINATDPLVSHRGPQLVYRIRERWIYDNRLAIRQYEYNYELATYIGPVGLRYPWTPAVSGIRTPVITDYGGYVRFWTLECTSWNQTTARKEPETQGADPEVAQTYTPDVAFGTVSNSPPPSPVERPLGYDLDQEQLESVCEFGPPTGGAFAVREVTDNLQWIPDQGTLDRHCTLMQQWKWGRPKGREFVLPFYDELVDHDEPFFTLDYVDARSGDKYRYICESPIWGLRQDEGAFRVTGLLVGKIRVGFAGVETDPRRPFSVSAKATGGARTGGYAEVHRPSFPVRAFSAGGPRTGGFAGEVKIFKAAGGARTGGYAQEVVAGPLDADLLAHWVLNEDGAARSDPLYKTSAPDAPAFEPAIGGARTGGTATSTQVQIESAVGGARTGGYAMATPFTLLTDLVAHWPLNEGGGSRSDPLINS